MPGRLPVFISWSGEPSRAVAAALAHYLPLMLNNVEIFFSPTIGSGRRWAREIDAALDRPGYGILCLAGDNATAPWINYEAGALAHGLGDRRVTPYLIGMTPTQIPAGPLTQFQADIADEEGTFHMLCAINEELGDAGVTDGHLREAFDVWWPKLDERIGEASAGAAPPPTPDARALLEEVVSHVRAFARNQPSARPRDPLADKARVLYALEELLGTGAAKFESEWLAGLMEPVPRDVTRRILLDLAMEGAWEFPGGPGDDVSELIIPTANALELIRNAQRAIHSRAARAATHRGGEDGRGDERANADGDVGREIEP